MGSIISSLGHYVPATLITNADLVKMGLDTSDEWIKERTGIKTRRFCDPTQASSDLGVKAAQHCLNNSTLSRNDIDLILVATSTPDHLSFPSTACIIQNKLNCKQIPAFDISAACSGFSYALTTATKFLDGHTYKHCLIVGVDCLSKITNLTDRSTAILFADGAGAALVSYSETTTHGLCYSKLYADGSLAALLEVPGGGTKNPLTPSTFLEKKHTIHMDGKSVFKTAVTTVTHAIKEAMSSLKIGSNDITYLVCHQANQRILSAIGKHLQLSESQLVSNVANYGNTSAASIPLALSELYEQKPFKSGDIIILAGFGAGFTWGINVIKWQ